MNPSNRARKLTRNLTEVPATRRLRLCCWQESTAIDGFSQVDHHPADSIRRVRNLALMPSAATEQFEVRGLHSNASGDAVPVAVSGLTPHRLARPSQPNRLTDVPSIFSPAVR